MSERFQFAVQPSWRVPLAAFGVAADRADLEVDEHQVRVRFGPWSMVTTRDNISAASLSGPFQWWKAIGVRLSLADRGITFGSSLDRGVCLQFHHSVPLRLGGRPLPLTHPAVTVTVRDPEGLVAAVLRQPPGSAG